MDIRLKIGFFDHPKTIKLKRKAGPAAAECLLRLWMYAAQYRPKGHFNGMTGEDIEIASHWNGEPGEFIAAACAVGYIDKDGDSFVLHDWAEHNPWAFHSEERSQKARESVAKRWAKRNEYGANEKCKTPSPTPLPLPSPLPSPFPTPSLVAVVDFETVRRIYSDVYRDLCPSVTICQKLNWIAENFDLQTITDAFAAASSAKAKTIDYVLTRLKKIKEREEERNGMAARLESGITQGVGF